MFSWQPLGTGRKILLGTSCVLACWLGESVAAAQPQLPAINPAPSITVAPPTILALPADLKAVPAIPDLPPAIKTPPDVIDPNLFQVQDQPKTLIKTSIEQSPRSRAVLPRDANL
ncbi:MAG: hypothetical protein K8T89_21080 [Planctomycetes bacterium]|nr:hypothetical protein [Planctomycetota bacterium]